MTENRRIVLNIMATYGRSLFNLACGLFTARWVLMALGQTDFGVYGVVGGLTLFITYLNDLFANATGRFYGVALGEAKSAGNTEKGIESCRSWFSVAMLLHTGIPLLAVCIGYPCGLWAIRNWLVIPPGRIEMAAWVWNFVCINSFITMISVPFTAMYYAKQYIAELTAYSLIQTILRTVFIYYMTLRPGDWLFGYSLGMCLIVAVPQLVIIARALNVFPECRFRLKPALDITRWKQLGAYAGWNGVGVFGGLVKGQGMSLVVNKLFGPAYNASMSVAGTVNAHVTSLASSVRGAMWPAIASAYGASDMSRVRSLAMTMSKYTTVLMLVFAIPLSLEIEYVLDLWLEEPPPSLAILCRCLMFGLAIDQTSLGHASAVNASGRIAAYHSTVAAINILSIPIAAFCGIMGWPIASIAGVIAISMALVSFAHAAYARTIIGMSLRGWLFGVILPVSAASIFAMLVGLLCMQIMQSSFIRLVLTTIACEIVFLLVVWFTVATAAERNFALEKIRKMLRIGN